MARTSWLEERLSRQVEGPPVKRYRGTGAASLEEEQTLVGVIDAPEDQREVLASYGIDMDLAAFSREAERWVGG